MTALLGYHTALLLRSQRWLPPVVLYGALLAVGVGMGDPLLDSLGYAAAALLPVAAWLVRICATQEPNAARHVTATAAGGPARAQLAVLVTALAAAGLLGAVGTVFTVLLGDARTTDRTAVIPLPGALVSGLLAAAVCALTGAALGALCTWPVLTGRGWSLAALSLGALLLLVTAGSPARTAVSALISGSRTGDTPLSLLPLAAAAAVATAAAALSCGLSSRCT